MPNPEDPLSKLGAQYPRLREQWIRRDTSDPERVARLAARVLMAGMTELHLSDLETSRRVGLYAHLEDGVRFGLNEIGVELDALPGVRTFVSTSPEVWLPEYGDVDAALGPLPAETAPPTT